MTTGTPLDLTPFGAVLSGIGIVYWVLALGALALALKKPKRRRNKFAWTGLVLLIFGWSPATVGWANYKAQQRLNTAMARFEERCKTAGEKIYRTVEGVEGVLLTNVRPESKSSDRSDPNWPDAALPDEGRGDWYIRKFLFWEQRTKNFYGDEPRESQRGYLNDRPSSFPGYRFVDVPLLTGGFRRVQLGTSGNAELISHPLQQKPTRYAVGFENYIDPEDRKYWIAGTKVTITDTETGQIIAESTWYSIDPGQGSTAGFRSPWGFAKTCPLLEGHGRPITRFFVDQVLKPKKVD